MRTDHRYEITIRWSSDDSAYVAEVPELPGCMADGVTHQDALARGLEAMQAWIDVARELGRPIPARANRRSTD